MKALKYILAFVSLFGFASIFAAEETPQDGSRFDQELNERDFEALRNFLNTKREEPLKEKTTDLAISGDVRFEYRHMNETLHGIRLRGHKRKNFFSGTPISRNDFDCEFNLKFDYIMERTWAVAHLQYDNSAGVDSEEFDCEDDPHGWFGSGNCDNICLRKAFMGYNLLDEECGRMDIELGRRGNLYHVFDSRVQFLSRFDGVLLKWAGKSEFADEWFLKLAGFVVDERITKLAWVTEFGLFNIADSGFDVKYSFIDWGNHKNRCVKHPAQCGFLYNELNKAKAYQFAVSQWTLAYNFDPELFCGQPAKLFGAFLMNHRWPNFHKRNGRIIRHTNLAGYAGLTVGEVHKEGDWAVEIQYQVVGATAVPGQDMSGIGTGNVYDFTLTRDHGVGKYVDNTNFRGWRVEGLYALTDNITLDTILEGSHVLNKDIGGEHTYNKVEVEAIYAF